MNGAEHGRQAEKLLTLAAQESRESPRWAMEYLAAAQVNATLALAYYVGQFVEHYTAPRLVPSKNAEGSGEPS